MVCLVGCVVSRSTGAAGPASGFLYSMQRVWGASYGWKRRVGVAPRLREPTLGWRGFCTFYREVLVGLSWNDMDLVLTVWAVLVDGPFSFQTR